MTVAALIHLFIHISKKDLQSLLPDYDVEGALKELERLGFISQNNGFYTAIAPNPHIDDTKAHGKWFCEFAAKNMKDLSHQIEGILERSEIKNTAMAEKRFDVLNYPFS